VDAANVVGSVPDGWWRDRVGATERLRDALRDGATRGLAGAVPEPLQTGPITVILVVEGAARGVASIDGVHVVAALESGDDEIVRQAAERCPQGWCAVATADRALAERVRAHGAVVIGPRSVTSRTRGGP
jgi:hypothetical protein